MSKDLTHRLNLADLQDSEMAVPAVTVCYPLFLAILFALYRVIWNIPAYVDKVKAFLEM